MDPLREAYWRRRLGRIRFGAEPIEEQVSRQFRVTLALSVVLCVIGLMILSIFWAFKRPDVGTAVVGVLVLPVIVLAWLELAVLRARVSSYLGEQAAHKTTNAPPS